MTRVRSRIIASFGVALLVITTGWVGAATISVSTAAHDQLTRARGISDEGDRLRYTLLEAEDARRGYLLTHDASLLAPYTQLANDPDPVARLERAIGTTGARTGIATLRADLDALRAELRRAPTEAHDLQRVLRDIAILVQSEVAPRDALRTRMTTALKAGRIVVLVGSLLAFSLAVIVNLSLMRALRDRELSQSTIVAQAEKLQLSNEELDRFAYATSHDLKAPLRGIINLVGWIEEDLGEAASADVQRNLELTRGRARRLEALIDGILTFSRAGRVREGAESVDIAALVREIAELNALPPGCRLTLADDLPLLVTERVPLQQVLMNLLQNAVKHGCPHAEGEIEMGGQERDGCWSFYVRDHGPGIDPQYHERIFGIFESLAPRDVVEGSGIGLAVVRKLVESRGGRVTVESQPGDGARFCFTWPTATPP